MQVSLSHLLLYQTVECAEFTLVLTLMFSTARCSWDFIFTLAHLLSFLYEQFSVQRAYLKMNTQKNPLILYNSVTSFISPKKTQTCDTQEAEIPPLKKNQWRNFRLYNATFLSELERSHKSWAAVCSCNADISRHQFYKVHSSLFWCRFIFSTFFFKCLIFELSSGWIKDIFTLRS